MRCLESNIIDLYMYPYFSHNCNINMSFLSFPFQICACIRLLQVILVAMVNLFYYLTVEICVHINQTKVQVHFVSLNLHIAGFYP